MKILLKTKVDRNGNSYGLLIDTDLKAFEDSRAYSDLEFTVTRKKIREVKEKLEELGYREV